MVSILTKKDPKKFSLLIASTVIIPKKSKNFHNKINNRTEKNFQ
jgi:hypothetical protein